METSQVTITIPLALFSDSDREPGKRRLKPHTKNLEIPRDFSLTRNAQIQCPIRLAELINDLIRPEFPRELSLLTQKIIFTNGDASTTVRSFKELKKAVVTLSFTPGTQERLSAEESITMSDFNIHIQDDLPLRMTWVAAAITIACSLG